jgi:hypothetical protein
MRKLLVLLLWPALVGIGLADTHYAARPDTNPWVRPAYPFASPETATPYIMDAMDAADPGDTVRVLSGTYGWDGATYHVKPGVDLMGSGRNGTTMLGRVEVGQGSMLSAFRFLETGVSAYSGGMINDCLFEKAVLYVHGVGTARRCTFTGETAGGTGQYPAAIIGSYGDDLRVLDCTFDLGRHRDGITVYPSSTVAGGVEKLGAWK